LLPLNKPSQLSSQEQRLRKKSSTYLEGYEITEEDVAKLKKSKTNSMIFYVIFCIIIVWFFFGGGLEAIFL
jgi:hypothetical protein